MKKESWFVVAFMSMGALVSLFIGLVLLTASTAPNDNLILTAKEQADFEHISNAGKLAPPNTILWAVLVICGLFAFALFLSALNPHIKGVLKSKTAFFKGVAVIIFTLLMICVALYLANTVNLIFLPLALPILWLVAGETGWAGDYSSWRFGANAKPKEAFLLGVGSGAIMWATIGLLGWSGGKYVSMVSEVWAGSSEVTWLGYQLLGYGFIIAATIGMGIFSSLTLALAPTRRTTGERLVRLIFPSVLLIGSSLSITIAYQIASSKYDLDKGTLAAGIGVTDKATVSKTIILLQPTDVMPEVWPLEISITPSMGDRNISGSIAVSYENLKKVEDYLRDHPDGSVFNYPAENALASGYQSLWDVAKWHEWLYKMSDHSLLARALLISRLSWLPTTDTNLNYLKSLSDEGKWQVGPKYCLRLAAAYRHFGMKEAANKWFEKGKAGGADTSTTISMNEPVLLDGSIKGTLTIGGKHPSDAMIGLINYTDQIKSFKDARYRLISAQHPDESGGFSFERLGEGEYLLAVMTGQKIIPSSSDVKVANAPGVIKLTADKGAQRIKDIGIYLE